MIAGGASIVRQCLAAGGVDEVNVSVVPLFLGGGERLFDDLGDSRPELEIVRAVDAPGVTHIKHCVVP